LAQNAERFSEGLHPGYEPNALEGLRLSLEPAAKHKIKLIVNGGALNPEGMAKVVNGLVRHTACPDIRQTFADAKLMGCLGSRKGS